MKKVRITLRSAVVVTSVVSATLWVTERNQEPIATLLAPEAERFTVDFDTQGAAVQPFFIKVGLERDTSAVLADYVPQFGSGILRLSGSPKQIERTAKTFRIYYQKIEQVMAPESYSVGHTSSFLLFNPQRDFVQICEYAQDPALLVADLHERIGA